MLSKNSLSKDMHMYLGEKFIHLLHIPITRQAILIHIYTMYLTL